MNSSSVEKLTTSSNHALKIATAITSNDDIDRSITALILKLQTTLNINQIFETFFITLKDELCVCGLEHKYPLLETHINLGRKTTSSNSYLIEHEHSNWGEIVVYTEVDLTENEKSRLEEYMSVIIYPTKNAILHQNAIVYSSNDSQLGLPNWGQMETQLTREAKLALRKKQSLNLLLIDIDRFIKLKNDHGLLFSDVIIRHVFETLQCSLRDTDVLYRFSYDQFSLILRDTHVDQASSIADRIRNTLHERYLKDNNDRKIRLTISVGIAELQERDSVDSIYERAYKALKLAKKSGRNQVKIADGKFIN